MAIGTLAVGMLFIAGVFPVSIYFTTVASERTIAATVADEAFAKIKLYNGYLPVLSDANQAPFDLPAALVGEYAYPSIPTAQPSLKRYWWSAVCRRIPGSASDVQVTVFVSRKVGANTQYRTRGLIINPLIPPSLGTINRPVPISIVVSKIAGGRADELRIIDNLPDGIDETTFVSDGVTIVDDKTGQIYRVLEKYLDTSVIPNVYVIRLDKNWQGSSLVWVVPPPTTVGRYPCIAAYQKIIRF